MLRRVSLCASCALVVFWIPLAVFADSTWVTGVSGDFGAAGNWDSGVPDAFDSATFNAAGTYTVTFDNSTHPLSNPVVNRNLFVSNGNVTFTSDKIQQSDVPYTYHVTGIGGGDALIDGGATLTLGSVNPPVANQLHMTVDDALIVRGGATLNVDVFSQVNTTNLELAQSGGTGTIVVSGSEFNVVNSTDIGRNGGTATLTYRGAVGAIATGGIVNLAVSGDPATVATLNIESSADVEIGNLNVGTGSAAATGTLNITSAPNDSSSLTQSPTSAITVGTAAGGIGHINLGDFAGHGILTTGSGPLTINATGTVTVAGSSELFANGDVMINGGELSVSPQAEFQLAAGKTFTVQNGGLATFSGAIFDGGSFFLSADHSKLVVGRLDLDQY